MAFLIKDRVLETCSSPGTGAATLLGAVTGYQSFSTAFSSTNGTTTYYCIADQSGANWEVGLGTWNTGNTLTRTTVIASSNAGATVNFASGTQNIFCTYPAEYAVYSGGPLGTPSSGTVTNLTGTASININGTVGATTANTGSFTTLSASSTVSGTGFSTYLASPPAIGSTTPNTGSFTSLTDSGNLTFTGTGNRITGDFSNATHANRVAFQTSTVNGATSPFLLPNGSGNTTQWVMASAADPTNSSYMSVGLITAGDARLNSGILGTGTYLPMTFYTGGSESMRLDTSGNVGIGTSSPSSKLEAVGTITASSTTTLPVVLAASNQAAGFAPANIQMRRAGVGGTTTPDSQTLGQIRFDGLSTGNVYDNAAFIQVDSGVNASGGMPSTMTFGTATSGANATERMRIDSSGNVGIGTNSATSKLEVLGNATFIGQSFTNLYTAGEAINFIDARNSSAVPDTNIFFAHETDGSSYLAFATTPAGSKASDRRLERMRIDSSGNLLIGYTSSNGSYKLQVNSQIFATSSTIATSDANYKENVIPLTNALDLVKGLNPVQFSWKQHPVHNFDTTTPTVGFIAQEVQATLSQMSFVNSVVKQSEVTLPDKTKEQFLGIAEGNMIAILTAALKELNAKFDAYVIAHP